MRVLPYFEPPFPAIVRQCNLCGKKLAEEKYETVEARQIEARQAGGQFIFCTSCSPHVETLTQIIEQERANLDAAHERHKESTIRELTLAAYEDLIAGGSVPSADAARPSPTGKRRRPPATRIPNPKVTDAPS
jgi:hypothetical protein